MTFGTTVPHPGQPGQPLAQPGDRAGVAGFESPAQLRRAQDARDGELGRARVARWQAEDPRLEAPNLLQRFVQVFR